MNKKNIALNIFWIILGTILVIASETQHLDNIYSGFGGGLIVCGIIMLIKYIRYFSNKDYHEKYDVEINDERNKYISMKAWSYAGYLFVIISACVTIICMVLQQTLLMQAASGCVCLITLLYWISYMVLRKKY